MKSVLFLVLLSLQCIDAFNIYKVHLGIFKIIFNTNKSGLFKLKKDININQVNSTANLVIFKGYGQSQKSYLDISKKIQKNVNKKNINMSVCIPYKNEIPDYLKDNKNIIFGHSQGGQDALEYNNSFANILYGATCNSENNLFWKSFPNIKPPTLTLVGNRDGYIRFTHLLDEKNNHKQVILVEGANHFSINGYKNNNFIQKILGIKDIKSYVSDEYSKETVAKISANYIKEQLQEDNKLNEDVMRYTNLTLDYYKYLLDIDVELFPKLVQKKFISLSSNVSIFKYNNFADFLVSKPSFKNNTANICIYKDIFGTMKFHNYFNKQRTPSLVMKLYCNDDYIKPKLYEINNNFYSTYDKLHKHTNKKIEFGEDIQCITTIEWLLRPVSITHTDNKVIIRNLYFKYKNYLYIKMMSPAQMYEWFMIDSLY